MVPRAVVRFLGDVILRAVDLLEEMLFLLLGALFLEETLFLLLGALFLEETLLLLLGTLFLEERLLRLGDFFLEEMVLPLEEMVLPLKEMVLPLKEVLLLEAVRLRPLPLTRGRLVESLRPFRLAPPVNLFTVAQARPAAVFLPTPRF
jgi:hypothetical protein